MKLLQTLFRVVLRGLPRDMRVRWGQEIEESLRIHVEYARRGGPLAMLRVFGAVLWDTWRWRVTLSRSRRSVASGGVGVWRSWVWADLRYAVRLYRRQPLQTLTICLTMAGAIAISGTIFSAINSVLLRPLPFPEPSRLVALFESHPSQSGTASLSWANYDDLRKLPVFESTGVAVGTRGGVRISGAEPFYADRYIVDAGFFDVIGVQPIIGRVPALVADGPSEAAITADLWATRSGGSPDVLGRTVADNNVNAIIVGVFPTESALPVSADIWVMDDIARWWGYDRTALGLIGFARLVAGTSVEEAQAGAVNVAASIRGSAGSGVADDFTFLVDPLHERLTRSGRDTLLLMGLAVGAVFGVTCINVAAMRSAQLLTRGRELAVRSSVGAGRWRLASQLVIESLSLAVVGGIVGTWAAWMLTTPLNALLPASYLSTGIIIPDWRIVAIGIGLGLVAAVISAIGPIRQVFRGPDFGVLRGGKGSGASRVRVQQYLVPQYAVSLATIIVTMLLIRTLISLGAVDPGFEPRGKLAIELEVPAMPMEEVAMYQQGVVEAISAVPGVTAAAFAYSLPLAARSSVVSGVQSDHDEADVYPFSSTVRTVSGGFFDTFDIPVVSGRVFVPNEPTSVRVAVVSSTLAEHLGGPVAAVGRSIRPRFLGLAGLMPDDWLEVIGVVDDVHDQSLRTGPSPMLYLLNTQNPGWARFADLVVQVDGSLQVAIPAMASAVRGFDSNLPIGAIRTYDDVLREHLRPQRFRALVLLGFGVATLTLVALGMYGTTAQAIHRRRRELALRSALGAKARGLVGLAVKQAVVTVIVGSAVGLGMTWAVSVLVRGMLFEVGPADPVSVGAGVALTAIAVLMAGWVPARHVANIDPVRVLKED